MDTIPTPTATVASAPWHLDAATYRALAQVDNKRSAAQLAVEVVLIAIAVGACERWWHPVLYVAVVGWIGARQHALAILMHESAHTRLFSNRRLNDMVGELVAWSLFVTMHGYRRSHLAHHQHLGTERDPDRAYWADSPDYRFPMPPGRLGRVLASYALGLRTLALVRIVLGYVVSAQRSTSSNASDRGGLQLARMAFYIGVAAAVTLLGGWRPVALYWFVPIVTSLSLLLYARSVLEHYGLDGQDHPLRATRSLRVGCLARWILVPNHIEHHLEHHLYPGVPFHRLPALRAALRENETYRAMAHETVGLREAWRELTSTDASTVKG